MSEFVASLAGALVALLYVRWALKPLTEHMNERLRVVTQQRDEAWSWLLGDRPKKEHA